MEHGGVEMKTTLILAVLMVMVLACEAEEPAPEPLTTAEARCTTWALDSSRRSDHQGNQLQELLDYLECLDSPPPASASGADLERRVQELERRLMELELRSR